VREPGLVGGTVNGLEQTLTVFTDARRECLPRRFGLGQVRVLDPTAVALDPLRWHPPRQPLRREGRQRIQGGPEGLPDALEAIQHPHSGEAVRRIGALPAARLEHAGLPGALQQGVQSPLLGIPLHQPGPEFTPHGMVNACVREGYPSGILPVNAGPHCIGSTAIRQALDALHYGHQRQACRGFGWLSTRGKQGRKLCVLVDGTEGISEPQTEGPFGGRRARDTWGCFRNLSAALRV
jgi:hypothetical protein